MDAAHALDAETGDLPLVGEALAAGEVTFEHAQVCVKAVGRLPRALKTCTVTDEATGEQVTGMQAVDRVLARTIREQPVRSIRYLTDRLVTFLDPGRKERFDDDAHLRRGVHLSVDSTGMGVFRATLTPADTAVLKALLAQWGKPNPATTCTVQNPDGSVQDELVRDERSLAMRQYDGMTAALRASAGGSAGQTRAAGHAASAMAAAAGSAGAGATPEVTLLVTATVEQVTGLRGAGRPCLDRVGPIGAGVFGYLACSATLTRVLLDERGVPVDVGRASRLAPPALRKALAVRDGGCLVPGCTVPAAGCDAHHVVPWSRGGSTDLTNMILLCGRHHQQVHADIWQVEFHDGVPWVSPPAWVDPQRRPRRNPLHHPGSAVQRLAEQLALAITDDDIGDVA